jgi:hypothetical protein
LTVLAGVSLSFGFGGFSSRQEAEEELARLYAPDSNDNKAAEERFNVHNSICKFMKHVKEKKKDSIIIAYTSNGQKDGAQVLKAYLDRQRGNGHNTPDNTVSVVKYSKIDLRNICAHKSFILGSPAFNAFLSRMEAMDRLQISSTKAQFRLFDYPNCIAIACSNNDMFVELIRVFIRSYPDFEEDSYIYFFQK